MWIAQKIIAGIVMLWAVITIVFFAIYLVPGDPAELLLAQEGASPSPEAVAALRVRLGLDQPIHVQYYNRLTSLLVGDFGTSMIDGSSVGREIAQRLPRTLELIAVATAISLVIGVPLGAATAARPGGPLDRGLSLLTSLGQSIPVFVYGAVFIFVFAQTLRWSSAGGFVELSKNWKQHIALLMLPASAIAFGLSAVVYRITRASVSEVLAQDYIRTARAKGLSRFRTYFVHAIRNAMIPVVTIVGLQIGTLIGGSVIVEYIFNWPGISFMLVNAVNARDYPVVSSVILVISLIFIAINIAVEILYAALDPRVRSR